MAFLAACGAVLWLPSAPDEIDTHQRPAARVGEYVTNLKTMSMLSNTYAQDKMSVAVCWSGVDGHRSWKADFGLISGFGGLMGGGPEKGPSFVHKCTFLMHRHVVQA